MSDSALSDIKILDLTSYVAGPYCTKLLADFGAEVVKVEKPGQGDPSRRVGPFPGDVPNPEKSGLFLHLNTSKRGITLDLKTPRGVSIFKELLKDVDAVVESFEPRVMPGLGLSYEELAAVNPRVIMTSISNFGQTGPYRDFAATELTLFAMEGQMASLGSLGREPPYFGGAMSQYFAGNMAAVATMAGITGARLQGLGQQIDISIMECWLGSGAGIASLTRYSYNKVAPRRAEEPAPSMHPAMDGFVHFNAGGAGSGGERGWHRLVNLMNMPELLDDGRFSTVDSRAQHADDLMALILPWLVENSKHDIAHAAQAGRVFAVPVLSVDEVVTDPHLEARGFFTEIDHPAAGRIKYPGAPAKMTKTPWRVARPAPLLGEHNEAVYRGRPGYAEAGLAPLREAGAAGASPAVLGGRHPRDERETGTPGLPLEGIRVIDGGDVLAAPFACTLLGDLGAEVVRVESIQRLAAWRGQLHPPATKPPGVDAPGWAYPGGVPGEKPYNRAPHYNGANRNKLGVTLNLRDLRGVELFKRLVAISDVLIENYAVGVYERLGLGYEVLSRINPGIIVISMPLFGNTGPYREWRGMGTDLDPMSGHVSIRGYPDGDPSQMQAHYHSDSVSAVTAAFTALAAVNYRRRTGKGQFIDLSEHETLLPHLGEAFMDYTMNGRVRGRSGNAHSSMAPHGCYRCKGEDAWVTIAVPGKKAWARFRRAIGEPPWAEEERFADASRRRDHQEELDELIAQWTSGHTPYEVLHLLQKERIPAGPVLNVDDIFTDPHIKERGFFALRRHEEAGEHLYPAPSWKFSRTPLSVRMVANRLGEHNCLVLGGLLGLSEAEVAELERQQVIGAEYLPNADR